ncbi:hypothetical protein GMOD_00000497 [Pyrenophora seminiperda CCB06]|uniref:Uncharacterized protein n=1 Tax=Pyrenophora seminiperda CCB06 TaxID=1302712 RepID=A0A3M7M7N9_9PLEO|nr:hypothetical protein GMOD_00000497 [Pyrenophora seminiperda CCB06]
MAWSEEAIITLIALVVTCIPLSILLWRYLTRSRRYSKQYNIEDVIGLSGRERNLRPSETLIVVQTIVRVCR